MKTKIVIFIVVVVAIAALIFGYVQLSREQAADAAADQPIAAAAQVQTGAGGETTVTLDLKAQQLIGLETATLAGVAMPPEMKAYGRVLDSAALVSLQNDVAAAQAALRVSRPEYERLNKLSAQDNTSAHALETAAAQLSHDEAALATAEAQLTAASGRTVAAEPARFFRSLGRQESVLVRLDLPAGEAPAEDPVAAQLDLPGGRPAVAADFQGRAAMTDPQVQGAGFLFSVTNPPPDLTPGLAITGFLQMPGQPAGGVVVPDAAVVQWDDRAWIYVQADDTHFVRRGLALDHPAPGGWFVTGRLTAGSRVVVTGAQLLLSEEQKSQIKLED